MTINTVTGAISWLFIRMIAVLGSLMVLGSLTNSYASNEDLNPVNEASSNTPAISVPPHPSAAAMEALGRKLFFDPTLSAAHNISCATCHDPSHAYGPSNARPVELGGRQRKQQGPRAVPSLRYLQNIPFFSEQFFDEDFDDSVNAGPTGGRTWDGRAATVQEQARLPLLGAAEMANESPEQVVASLQKGKYTEQFRQTFGADIFKNPQAAFAAACQALEVFQQNPAEFYPYSSKYDAFLRGQTKLNKREQHGLVLFNDPKKGNCAACHQSAVGTSHALPSFSDFGYIALGVPRNLHLTANDDPNFHDLGLCGPYRRDLTDRPEYCGLFRTPSLRNVALRKTFFHNGVFHNLKQVLEFYVQRESHPEKWYARDAHGKVQKYDDLPAQYHKNINHEAPFDKGPKDKPSLNAAEIQDVIVFLNTLTDGWAKSK
ncbi:cytochrome c peroxidase [Methylomonas sp. AM2-LC]|uniref:cytochrome-c peroxidase n=1 Tax=Methylomonas sp. AM2-LC TaxID=3153301 RepID=UPI003266263B